MSSNQPYVVRAGEYLTAIAYGRGLKPNDVWNDPDNADLKKLRVNPEMLAPGDVLYLPPVVRTWLPLQVGSTNQLVAKPPKVELHVVLSDPAGQPYAGKAVHLDPQVAEVDPTTDGTGLLKVLVPVTVKVLTATIIDDGTTFQIRVGHLDPHDVVTGTVSRLRQLGYIGDERRLLALDRPYLNGIDAVQSSLTRGIAAFQEDQGSDVDGACDDDVCDQICGAHDS
jgi:hypothetical protein